MSTAKKGALKKKRAQSGEDYLNSFDQITFVLENGSHATLHIDRELRTPDDPVAIQREARMTPGRFAFWAYQAERAHAHVRELEDKLEELCASYDMAARKWLRAHTDIKGFTEAEVKSYILQQHDVVKSRMRLRAAKKQLGFIRATKEALNHRSFILHALIAQKPERQ